MFTDDRQALWWSLAAGSFFWCWREAGSPCDGPWWLGASSGTGERQAVPVMVPGGWYCTGGLWEPWLHWYCAGGLWGALALLVLCWGLWRALALLVLCWGLWGALGSPVSLGQDLDTGYQPFMKNTSGEDMGALVQVTCTFTINDQPFTKSFIVCRHMQ